MVVSLASIGYRYKYSDINMHRIHIELLQTESREEEVPKLNTCLGETEVT